MLRVIPLLVAMRIKVGMEYRAASVIDTLAMLSPYASVYATFCCF